MRKPILTRFARFLLRLCVIYRMHKENSAKRKFQPKNITKIKTKIKTTMKTTMKKKIIKFDLETAKKIQAGEIEGAIETRKGLPVRLLCTDIKGKQCVVIATLHRDGSEVVDLYGVRGNFRPNGAYSEHDIVLKVPDTEHEFKPFDKVLVRDDNSGEWCLALYAYYRKATKVHRMVGGTRWVQCIPYEGNERLLGTTDKPNEEIM